MNRNLIKVLISFTLVVVSINSCVARDSANNHKIKNVIIMISDGFSPAGATLGRYVKGKNLNLDSILVGTLQTKSANSLITDSAAAATAYATGSKTNNRVISKAPATGHDLSSLFDLAKQRGMSRGVVVTDQITGATPASFYAHALDRGMHIEIAEQLINSDLDVMLGGGDKYFLPTSAGGKRKDKRNLINEVQSRGINFVKTKSDLLQVSLMPVLGLFARNELAYTVDRQNIETTEPSLYEMSQHALELLRQNENGFMLMIEGSRIDHAAHSNDAAAFGQEIISYDDTIGLVKQFIDNNHDTLLVAVTDHGTGGITVGRSVNGKSEYTFYPEVLREVKHSREYFYNYLEDNNSIDNMIKKSGLTGLTSKDIKRIKYGKSGSNTNGQAVEELTKIINEKSRTGWTTKGHTAIDTNIYAYGIHSDQFIGNNDNTFVANKIAELLGAGL